MYIHDTLHDTTYKAVTSQDGSLMVLDTIGFGDTRLPPEAVVKSLRDTALEAWMVWRPWIQLDLQTGKGSCWHHLAGEPFDTSINT